MDRTQIRDEVVRPWTHKIAGVAAAALGGNAVRFGHDGRRGRGEAVVERMCVCLRCLGTGDDGRFGVLGGPVDLEGLDLVLEVARRSNGPLDRNSWSFSRKERYNRQRVSSPEGSRDLESKLARGQGNLHRSFGSNAVVSGCGLWREWKLEDSKGSKTVEAVRKTCSR